MQYGRSFPRESMTGEDANRGVSLSTNTVAFGVSLLTLVDAHRTVERWLNCGVPFIFLMFTVFFVSATIAGLRIHPLQFLLVGTALCRFFSAF